MRWSHWIVFWGLISSSFASLPNLVLIMADDLGYGDISPYGGWIETPHLEKMAAEGIRFTDFHTSGAVCSPTRAGLLTGRYQHRAGVPSVILADPNGRTHPDGLQASEFTLAEALDEAGYRTGIFGKWHLGYSRRYNPIFQGFDEYKGYISGNIDFFSHIDQAGAFDWWHQDRLVKEEGYVTHLITKHAKTFIESNYRKPFFLYIPHEAPHYPYQGPGDKAEREEGKKGAVRGQVKDRKRAYREMVEEMDKGIGEVLKALKDNGLDEKTLVVFISDNGASKEGSNGVLRGHKGSAWEGGHRVPAIVRWPGKIAGGRVSEELAWSLDLMPTFLSLAGVRGFPKSMDGIDLAAHLLKGESLPERTLFWEANGHQAARKGHLKWVKPRSNKADRPEYLFDLQADLGEKKNLMEEKASLANGLKEAFSRWYKEVEREKARQPSDEA